MMDIISYMNRNKKVGEFGIKYLDDKTDGILKSDLVLIGARSGAGKSTLAEIIAINNAKKGYPVHLFSLENFEGDNFITRAYYKYKSLSGDYKISQRQFASGNFNKNMDYLIQAQKEVEKNYTNITMIARKNGYTIQTLCDDFDNACQAGAQLIILDHIDYIDKDNNNLDDINHVTRIMNKIREAQDKYGVAVVAFSHLRKPVGKDLPVIPSIDEFIGSSNKAKQATAVIMVAPDDKTNEDNPDTTRKSTWFCIRKLRMGGIDNKAARLFFDRKTGNYESEYREVITNYSGTKVTEIL